MMIIIIAVIGMIFVFLRLYDRFPCLKIDKRGIFRYYFRRLMTLSNVTLSLCVVVVDFFYKWFDCGTLKSATEWVFNLFTGHGTGSFQVLPFLEMMISNGVPLYLLAVFFEQTVNEQSLFVSVRTRGRLELIGNILLVSMEYLIVYALFWLIAGFAGAIFLNFKSATDSIWTLDFINILFYAVLMKFLDILVQYLVMLVIYFFTKQITAGFLVLVVGNLFCIFSGNLVLCLPFGLSSLIRIDITGLGLGSRAIVAFGVEIGISILLILYIMIFGHKKILN